MQGYWRTAVLKSYLYKLAYPGSIARVVGSWFGPTTIGNQFYRCMSPQYQKEMVRILYLVAHLPPDPDRHIDQ